MTGLVEWAGARARMILAFIVLSITVGAFSYVSLPKTGEPDIEIPALFISVPAPGISAEDSERLIVKLLESNMSGLEGLKSMTGTAAEGYGAIALEFDFGWDKEAIKAEVRENMQQAESKLPDIAENYTINEINFSEFPIVVVTLSGDVPERVMLQVAKDLQDNIESLSPVLSADVTGLRDELLEVIIDPAKLELYDISAESLINVVTANNRLIAAGTVTEGSGEFALKIPSSFDDQRDVMNLPIKINGDAVVTIGDIADIRLTFEDREGTARFNGQDAIGIQVVKRKGENLIDTVTAVREEVARSTAAWPEELKQTVAVDLTLNQSNSVEAMVSQLESSVLTAIALVMIAVLASLGLRSALLVGFSIPTSFLLCFALLSLFDIEVSSIVMFGLILAVGMLVDGAIVVVEYADLEISRGIGPMRAYVSSAKRMFWPIISSTATTLCAFLPLLFAPGIAGQFMGNLPRTIIFVLGASLVVALIYLPVVGGVAGRISRWIEIRAAWMRTHWSKKRRWIMTGLSLIAVFMGLQLTFRAAPLAGGILTIAFIFLFVLFQSTLVSPKEKIIDSTYKRRAFGHFIAALISGPVRIIGTFLTVALVFTLIFFTFKTNNNGTTFFVDTEPEQINVYVQARGNLSVAEKDRLVRQVEKNILDIRGVLNVFASAGAGGLNQNTGGGESPSDTIGILQMEFEPWEVRGAWPDNEGKGANIKAAISEAIGSVPGVKVQILDLAQGPAAAKPINIRFASESFDSLANAVIRFETFIETLDGVVEIEDSRPLPGIDWQLDIDVTEAGRYGTNVAQIGGMVQLVTRGVTLGQMRVDTSDEEIDIRARYPESDRLLSTLDRLRVQTPGGLVPLANFTTRTPVQKLGQIDRYDQKRVYTVKAGVTEGVNANERLGKAIAWLDEPGNLPSGVTWEAGGDFADQEEFGKFLGVGFLAALGLMFVILLAQFNSFYNSALVLLAVIFSIFGVLIGLMVMGQPFSFIMTGTGVLALAGIVVNNNIILIDTYQDFRRYMPEIEAIIRTAETRIRPVLLTTVTTILVFCP